MGNMQGTESDLWSLGILLYELHMGKEPFPGKSSSDMLHLISNQPIKFSSKYFSREAMNLVKCLLKFKANKRMKLHEINRLKFVQKFRKSIDNDETCAFSNVKIPFNPPQQVFTSQYQGKSNVKTSRKSRPKFNNMDKFKTMINEPGSLYQPNQFEISKIKSSRNISNRKRLKSQVIQPKIYLRKNDKNKERLKKIEHMENINSFRTKKSKTFSQFSGGFLSKEDDKTISREINYRNNFMKKELQNTNEKKKLTLSTKNDIVKDYTSMSGNNESLQITMTPRTNPKMVESSTMYNRFNKNLSSPKFINSSLMSGTFNRSQDKLRPDRLDSSKKHFIRSTNSEIKHVSRAQKSKNKLKEESVRK